MRSAQDHRIAFVNTITHIRGATTRVIANSGFANPLTAPDLHKISEGLFLSAVTHWEEFCQVLLLTDLATNVHGALRRDAKKFRTTGAPLRLAELVLTHVDHPNSFYDWSEFGRVCARADRFLGPNHRFAPPAPVPPAVKPPYASALPTTVVDELAMFKRIRNAVAHKSDKAWESFMKLIKAPPFSLPANKRKGITPGRFLSNTQWGGKVVILHALDTLESASLVLVP
jgi:hypothetical protein